MHGMPTDCPQRCERLGWSGDAQIFAQTAIFNRDMAAFFSKWSRDVREAQARDGRFPDFAPHPHDPDMRFAGNPGWGDAGVIVPWQLYINYGDRGILAEQFPAAKRYIDWITAKNPGGVWDNFDQLTPLCYGDWLNADTFKDLPGFPAHGGEVPKAIFATAYYAYSTQLVARMAEILGAKADAVSYGQLARRVREIFNQRFVAKTGKIRGDTQAGYALGLSFDLLPERLRPAAARYMVAGLQRYGGALSTGIHSTIRMMNELTRHGYHAEAYALLLRTEMPSWGYMVENGGTTIWERWDGWVKGRGFQDPGMNSFNHYAIGAVGEWVWRSVIGLNPDVAKPGWKHFTVRPVPGGGLTWAKGEYQSIQGPIGVDWKLRQGKFHLRVSLPPGADATVYLPFGRTKRVRIGAGVHRFETNDK